MHRRQELDVAYHVAPRAPVIQQPEDGCALLPALADVQGVLNYPPILLLRDGHLAPPEETPGEAVHEVRVFLAHEFLEGGRVECGARHVPADDLGVLPVRALHPHGWRMHKGVASAGAGRGEAIGLEDAVVSPVLQAEHDVLHHVGRGLEGRWAILFELLEHGEHAPLLAFLRKLRLELQRTIVVVKPARVKSIACISPRGHAHACQLPLARTWAARAAAAHRGDNGGRGMDQSTRGKARQDGRRHRG
mmetsp:Transcript_2959/g.8604  ORF Transcript_2959/g.8604 Transcript_2959/m.8604 type:complete len:248 (+) Transcript_2959:555-1298(+)